MNTLIIDVSRLVGFLIVLSWGSTELMAGEDFPVGCWRKETRNGRTISALKLCFYENRELIGVEVDQGHGADFGDQWDLLEPGKLQFKLQDSLETCSVLLNEAGPKLVLDACTAPMMNGTFEKTPD